MGDDELYSRLHELFEVDVQAGSLVRRKSIGLAKKGLMAGSLTPAGYREIGIDRKKYFFHNLIWFLAYKKWPDVGFEIDHRNRVKDDNRLSNLRLCTRSQNNANHKLRSDNITGVRGVYFSRERKKFIAQITVNGITKNLGRFKTISEAAAVAKLARVRCFGEFAIESH